MNLIRNFENRIAEAFGSAPQGYQEPFSFKKLARQAAKQMENETYVIDGVDTAPALYTVLVSPADDTSMRPLYPRLTQEVVGLVKAQAQAKGYVFVGEPLARFLVDSHLRSGHFSVFADNVDAETLERLRAEENAFLSQASVVGGAAADRKVSHEKRRPTKRPARAAAKETPQATDNADDLLVPVIPERSGVAPVPAPAAVPAFVPAPLPAYDTPVPSALDDSASMGLDIVPIDFLDNQIRASHLTVPDIETDAEPIDVPVTQRRADVVIDPAQDLDLQAEADFPVTCILVDRQTGNTYVGTAPRTAIGRERMSGSIILRDPNVSRRHAELLYEGGTWLIHDLNSTNGTMVNDVEITQCALRDGDLITVGLMNLEFKEG